MKYFLLLLLLPIFAYSQRDTNISVISAERYAIVYRGISNPIKIAVPGAVSFAAEAPGLKKVDDNGNYEFNVTSVPGDTVVIKIVAKMPDSSFIRESKTFEIHNFGRLNSLINGKGRDNNVLEMTKKEFKTATISLSINEIVFDSKLTVNSFEIYMPKLPAIIVKGNTVSKQAAKYIEKLDVNDEVYISNIKYTLRDMGSYKMQPPSPIIIKIINEQ